MANSSETAGVGEPFQVTCGGRRGNTQEQAQRLVLV